MKNRRISKSEKELEERLLASLELLGLREFPSNIFCWEDVSYRVRAKAHYAECKEAGGKIRAYKLIRLALMARLMASTPAGCNVTDVVGGMLEDLAKLNPVLQQFCEPADVGAP